MIRPMTPPAIMPKPQLTVNEFEHFLRQPENQEGLFELINGEIVEKMPTEEHGYLAGLFITMLNNYVISRKLGIVATKARHRPATDTQNDRIPDVSFSKGQRSLIKAGAVPRMPDLAIEIQSPDDSIKAMREKAAYYLANRTQLVWLVFPQKRYIEVYRPGEEMEILFGSDVLEGGDLLPGFTLSVTEVFADPVAE